MEVLKHIYFFIFILCILTLGSDGRIALPDHISKIGSLALYLSPRLWQEHSSIRID